jgi:hypothetical protein
MRQGRTNINLLFIASFVFSLALELTESDVRITTEVVAARVWNKTLALGKQEEQVVAFAPPACHVRDVLITKDTCGMFISEGGVLLTIV